MPYVNIRIAGTGNVKLAQRVLAPIARSRERAGVRETGMAAFTIRSGIFSMPVSREQKARIAAEITDTLERIAHKSKSYTYIAFDELPDENWAIAGQLLDEK